MCQNRDRATIVLKIIGWIIVAAAILAAFNKLDTKLDKILVEMEIHAD